MSEEREPARLGAGEVVGVRLGDGRGNNSFSSSSSSSSGMRGVAGKGASGANEWTLHSSLTFGWLDQSVSRVVVDGPVSLERRRLSTSSTLIETPREP